MIPQKDRIEAAIRHIQTAADVDPWAMELAVDALKAQGTCEDAVSRQTLQKELALYLIDDVTSEDEAGYNRAINDVQKMVLHLPSAQQEHHTCVNCGRTMNNGGWYADGGTRCPIEEHYALPKDGFCHLWEKRNVTDDDYPERRTDE